jgi:hypothetical protein
MTSRHDQSLNELTAEIEKTRAHLEDTLDALQQRVSPDRMVEQFSEFLTPARDGTSRFARNLGRAVQDNPVPAALVGIGLGWLALSGRHPHATAADAGNGNDSFRADPHRPGNGAMTDTEDAAGDQGTRLHQAREWARQQTERARDVAGERGERAYRHASDTVHHASDTVHHELRRVRNGGASIGGFVKERPIISALAVAGLGAVIAGTVFARSDRGRAAIDRGSEAVREGAERAAERASDLADTAAKRSAEAAGDAARAAKERVSGLTGEAETTPERQDRPVASPTAPPTPASDLAAKRDADTGATHSQSDSPKPETTKDSGAETRRPSSQS